MNIHGITQFDTANGLGIGTVLWVSGCEHHCLNCHNPQTWDIKSGRYFDHTGDDLDFLLKTLEPDYISRLTISGGDPLHPFNRWTVGFVLNAVKQVHPEVKTWLYTGYEWEQAKDIIKPFAYALDYLVDGRFIESLKDLNLPYRGSSNQHIIDVKTGNIVDFSK